MVQAKVNALDMLWYHRWFAMTVFFVVIAVALVVSCLQTPLYEVSADIFIAPRATPALGENRDALPEPDDARTLNNQVEILASDQVAEKASNEIRAKFGKSVKTSAVVLQKHLTIQKKDDSNVLAVRLSGATRPQTLVTMLTLYLKAYQDTVESINSNKAGREAVFLANQLEVSQQELRSVSAQMRDYGMQNDVYNLDAQTQQMLQLSSHLDSQSQDVNADMAALQREIDSTRRHLPASADYVNLMARIERDPQADALHKRIVVVETEQAEWAGKLMPAHPKMKAYQQELIRLGMALDERLQFFAQTFKQAIPKNGKLATGSTLDFSLASDIVNDEIKLEALKARSAKLTQAQQDVQTLLKNLPRQALDYATLKGNYDRLQEKVRTLQKQVDDASLKQEVAKRFTRLEILKNPTLPKSPVYPNLLKTMTAALLLGLCLSLLGVFARVSLDRRLRWAFQLPPLIRGRAEPIPESRLYTLPELPNRQSFATLLDRGNVSVPEAYQRFGVQLEALSRAANIRRIGLLPVGAFEDASMTALSLALYLTGLENKVVLLDADFSEHSASLLIQSLRLPISAAIQEGPGLSDYLSGQLDDFVDIIYPLGKTVYGSLVPAGERVQSDMVRFSARHLGHVEENLSPNYNFVLYSLPALQVSYDAAAVARTLDGVFLVVYPGVSLLDQITQSLQDLETVGAKLLGILIQPV